MAEVPQRLTDQEMWRCVETTVRDVLLPSITDDWARAAAVQLVGLARYAADRPGDDIDAVRRAARRDALVSLVGNRYVDPHWDGASPPDDIDSVIGAVLADAVGHDDDDARVVHETLRALLRAQLDDELAVTARLVRAFRGDIDA